MLVDQCAGNQKFNACGSHKFEILTILFRIIFVDGKRYDSILVKMMYTLLK